MKSAAKLPYAEPRRYFDFE